MRYQAENAFVLHARRWRETSLLLELLSEQHGRIGLVARGVNGPKRQATRAALQPLQHVRIDGTQRGELGWLSAVEALDRAPLLGGDAMLAGFYVNELLIRLVPRQDPNPDLYFRYAQLREELRIGAPLAWTLRRFERDLLECLGVGFALDVDADGEPVDPAARYVVDAESGLRRLHLEGGHETMDRRAAATGQALLALAADTMPALDDMASLRLCLRRVLAHHLGPKGLKSWELMGDLGRLQSSA